jgi:hypothetical protein
MKESPQQVASRLARKAALAVPPDVLEHPMPFPARLDYAEAQIKRTIPIELYEKVRQASLDLLLPIWSCCADGRHSPAELSCIPGRRLAAALDELERELSKP